MPDPDVSVFTNPISRATEEAKAYTEAVLALLGDREPTSVLDHTPGRVRDAIAGLSEQALRRPERPGKWSPLEVVQHLADSELVWAYRMRLVAAEDRPTLSGYDQDRWANRLGYRDVDVDSAIGQFDFLRRLNLRFLAGLPREAFDRVGMHSERGQESLAHMIRLYAGHDLVHLRQLDRMCGTEHRE